MEKNKNFEFKKVQFFLTLFLLLFNAELFSVGEGDEDNVSLKKSSSQEIEDKTSEEYLIKSFNEKRPAMKQAIERVKKRLGLLPKQNRLKTKKRQFFKN